MESTGPEKDLDRINSCDPSFNRKQFLELVVKRAGLAGAILIAPKVVDTFLVPPAYARMYSVNFHEDTTGNHIDTG